MCSVFFFLDAFAYECLLLVYVNIYDDNLGDFCCDYGDDDEEEVDDDDDDDDDNDDDDNDDDDDDDDNDVGGDDDDHDTIFLRRMLFK